MSSAQSTLSGLIAFRDALRLFEETFDSFSQVTNAHYQEQLKALAEIEILLQQYLANKDKTEKKTRFGFRKPLVSLPPRVSIPIESELVSIPNPNSTVADCVAFGEDILDKTLPIVDNRIKANDQQNRSEYEEVRDAIARIYNLITKI